MVIIIHPPIIRMSSKIVEINRRVDTANQDLHFLLVEYPTKIQQHQGHRQKKEIEDETLEDRNKKSYLSHF